MNFSPYCGKLPIQHKGLIMQHLIVRKLTRRELEDKYLRIIDENYELKRENNIQKEKIKILTTKFHRLSKENSRFKSREFLLNDEIPEAEEYFRPRRPASSSAVPREIQPFTRSSTPNLSRFKSDFFMSDNSFEQQANVDDSRNKVSLELPSSQMEDRIRKLTVERDKLIEEMKSLDETQKQTNSQFQLQIKELEKKLETQASQNDSGVDEKIESLNKTIKELQSQIQVAEKSYQDKVSDCKKEKDELINLLEIEKQKVAESQSQIKDALTQYRSVEEERAELITKCSKLAIVTEELESYKRKTNELTKVLAETERALEKERADKASIEQVSVHSQENLLKVMKDLQKENDSLAVKLEGLKTENESLLSKNEKLEHRIKVLDDQNKEQIQQINNALSMPKQGAVAQEYKPKKESERVENRNSTSQPSSLTIPPVPLNEEMRPATPEKELKVIPKIVEPSETSATFAETFSRSVSKDRPTDDDEFDPNTFSIVSDQVSDAEGVSELVEDEEDYEYLFDASNF